MHLRNNHIEKQREKNTKQKPNITERLGLYLIHEVKKCNGHLFLFFFFSCFFFPTNQTRPDRKRKTWNKTKDTAWNRPFQTFGKTKNPESRETKKKPIARSKVEIIIKKKKLEINHLRENGKEKKKTLECFSLRERKQIKIK